jgi:ectoine hydroxylase-related dioxygenase (phytanoyl-CoA dioxygenase family)
MEIDQATFELDVFGFTVLPEVLSAAEAARLAALLDAADAARGVEYTFEDAFARLIPNAPAIDDAFLPLIDHPRVLAVIEAALGHDLVLGSMNARVVRPGDPAQGLHSDIPLVHRRVLGAPVMLQATWMIDGFTADNGATCIVPGSHRSPESVPPKDRAIPHILAPTAPAGSVLIFNGQCWHGGGANRSSARRRAIFGHYRVGAWMRFQSDPTAHFPQQRWDAMSARQRELLRMEIAIDQPNAADHYAGRGRGRYD